MLREASWVVALLFVGVGGFTYQQSLEMPDNVSGFTKALGALMVVLSAILMVREFRTARKARAVEPAAAGSYKGYLVVLMVVAMTTAYIYFLPQVGYLYLTTAYFAAMMWMLGLRNLLLLPVMAAGGAFAMYFVFVRLLHVTLT